jgi:hypothetical protein
MGTGHPSLSEMHLPHTPPKTSPPSTLPRKISFVSSKASKKSFRFAGYRLKVEG